jgi:8-oxo-dGTP diphosphatase
MVNARGNPEEAVVMAAGGLLVRDVGGGRRLAVIHRARHGDWTLPKGKVDPGETLQQAALREVLEETGWPARLTAFAGAFGYMAKGAPKIVAFWMMEPAGEGAFAPSEEVAELVWLAPEEAVGRLDHGPEREIVQRTLIAGPERAVQAGP